MAGRSSIVMKARELGFDVNEQSPAVKDVLEELKRLEFEGYEFEAADASLKLLLARWLKQHTPAFEFEGYRVIIERRGPESSLVAEATVKVKVNGKSMHTVAECVGPVSALDKALRLALERAYPAIKDTTLSDYKVRILDSQRGTNSRTRVLIETSDGEEIWGTVGVSDNVIEASWEALCDAFEYKLLREEEKKKTAERGNETRQRRSVLDSVLTLQNSNGGGHLSGICRALRTDFYSIGANRRLRSSAMLPSRPAARFLGRHRQAVGDQLLRPGAHGAHLGFGVDEHADLEVHEERAQVEVGGPEQADAVVDDHALAVHHARLVEQHLHAGLLQFPQVITPGMVGDRVVRPSRHHELDLVAGPRLHQQRAEDHLVGNEIGRDDPDAVLGLLDERDDALVERVARDVRSAGHDLQFPRAARIESPARRSDRRSASIDWPLA